MEEIRTYKKFRDPIAEKRSKDFGGRTVERYALVRLNPDGTAWVRVGFGEILRDADYVAQLIDIGGEEIQLDSKP